MKKSTQANWVVTAPTLFLGVSAWAQNAPGEDPVILTKRITVQMMPARNAITSSPLNMQTDMPAWMKAKVARYEAKSNADQTSGFLTDADVTRSATSDGFKKTCLQEVGSASAAGTAPGGKIGLGNNQQIVVLRGDLVNICK